jgi:hypothetical protein
MLLYASLLFQHIVKLECSSSIIEFSKRSEVQINSRQTSRREHRNPEIARERESEKGLPLLET